MLERRARLHPLPMDKEHEVGGVLGAGMREGAVGAIGLIRSSCVADEERRLTGIVLVAAEAVACMRRTWIWTSIVAVAWGAWELAVGCACGDGRWDGRGWDWGQNVSALKGTTVSRHLPWHATNLAAAALLGGSEDAAREMGRRGPPPRPTTQCPTKSTRSID